VILPSQRVALGLAESPLAAARQAIAIHGGVAGLFVGWQANLAKDVPFAVLKLSLFEACVRAYEAVAVAPVGANERTACGVASGALTAVLTNPLDVVNTRLKSAGIAGATLASAARDVVRREGPAALFAGLGPRVVIIGLGSGVFWGVQSHCRRFLGLPERSGH
jgi:hypothetical protein